MTARLLVLERAAVDALRRALARERTLWEVADDGGDPDWRATTGEAPFDFDAPLPLAGAKRFFFPPREPLVRWKGDRASAVEPAPRPFVLFGMRACDVAAVAYQDRFFAEDAWYARRRTAALLVALDCPTACPGGFCADVDAGPWPRAGFDLSLAPLDDGRVAVEVASVAGLAALERAGVAVRSADAAVRAALERRRDAARASFPARPFVHRAIARVDARAIDDTEWRALAPACFACTGCTSLCPTCSCFTVVDEARDGGGERVRLWDSCLLEGFQREASGHHPAPRAADRVRRFWFHKLSGDFAPSGRTGCVGCGRCDVACPGTIGALRVLAALGAG
jgi:sulfhydrogenase subunit beta (sulfur reductase)